MFERCFFLIVGYRKSNDGGSSGGFYRISGRVLISDLICLFLILLVLFYVLYLIVYFVVFY